MLTHKASTSWTPSKHLKQKTIYAELTELYSETFATKTALAWEKQLEALSRISLKNWNLILMEDTL